MTNINICIIFAVRNRKINLKNRTIMATIHLTKGGFERRVADIANMSKEWKFLGNRPAVIDFYATWCGPCKALLPVVEQLSEEYDGKVDIYKVNVDEEQELARLFEIRSIPTLIFIPMEGKPQRTMGAMPKEQLKSLLDQLITK